MMTALARGQERVVQEGAHSRGGSSAANRSWGEREVYIASGRMEGAGEGAEISWEIANARWPYLGARAHDTHPSTNGQPDYFVK